MTGGKRNTAIRTSARGKKVAIPLVNECLWLPMIYSDVKRRVTSE